MTNDCEPREIPLAEYYKNQPWGVRDALFELIDAIAGIKRAVDNSAEVELAEALDRFRKWKIERRTEDRDADFGGAVCRWAKKLEEVRLAPFHWTPDPNQRGQSWSPATYALYRVASDFVDSLLTLSQLENWPPDQLFQELRKALSTFDPGFFTRELEYEFTRLIQSWKEDAKKGVLPSKQSTLASDLSSVVESRTALVPPTDDPTAYRAAKEFIDDQHPDFNAIRKVLKDNPWIRNHHPLSKAGRPTPNRLHIHAGDWKEYLRQRQGAAVADPLDLPAAVYDSFLEIAQRKEEVLRERGQK